MCGEECGCGVRECERDCYCYPHRFCRGCAVPCDEGLMGRTATYVAVDWDLTALHLKYQQAQERVRVRCGGCGG